MLRSTYLRFHLLVSICCCSFFATYAQESVSNNSFDIGIEFQAYPTGIIPGIRAELGWNKRHAIHLRVGRNFAWHRDLGVQDEEQGGGLGFTLGYKRYFSDQFKRWFLGVRSDLWFNSIDWKDYKEDNTNELLTSGTTEIIVFQPTLEGGYLWELADGKWVFAPTLAVGAEINIQTEGEEVGQGATLIAGFHLAYRF